MISEQRFDINLSFNDVSFLIETLEARIKALEHWQSSAEKRDDLNEACYAASQIDICRTLGLALREAIAPLSSSLYLNRNDEKS